MSAGVATPSETMTPSGGPNGGTTPTPVKSTGRDGLPKYGIVRWRDAAGATGKLRRDRLTVNLPVREDIGWLFIDQAGTIQVLHNRVLKPGQTNRYTDVEYTLIPAAWVVEVIPLAIVSESLPVQRPRL